MSKKLIGCILAAALILLAGCGGNTYALYQNGNLDVHKMWDSYNPQAPAIDVPSWRQALSGAPALENGGFRLVALDNYNRPAPLVLRSLRLVVQGDLVQVLHSGGLNAASLYLLFDGSRQHPAALDASQPGAVGAAIQVEVARQVDGAHPSLAEKLHDLVSRAETRAGLDRPRREGVGVGA